VPPEVVEVFFEVDRAGVGSLAVCTDGGDMLLLWFEMAFVNFVDVPPSSATRVRRTM
jgi:hypothetical protein